MSGNGDSVGLGFRDGYMPESPRVQELRQYLSFLTDALQRKRRLEELAEASKTGEESEWPEKESTFDLIPAEEVEPSESSNTLTEGSEISLRNNHLYYKEGGPEDISDAEIKETMQTKEEALPVQNSALGTADMDSSVQSAEPSIQTIRMRLHSHPIDLSS